MNQIERERRHAGATVKALRDAYGWRVSKFAIKIGVSHSYLSNIEAGRKPLTPELARRIADVLDVPLAAVTSDFTVDEVA